MRKALLLLCAASMLVLASCNKPGNDNTTAQGKAQHPDIQVEEGARLPIAVINIDTLLNNYDLAILANENLLKKQEDARLDLAQRARSLQNEMVDFQNKLENQAFLSRERAEKEQQRLMRKEQELQSLEQEKSQELVLEQQKVNMQIRDSINNVLSTINTDGKYHLILSTSALNDNVLFAADAYNITWDVLDMLNDRYNKK